ncbi:MAG TPA: zinc ribbon domain-containing protein [Thermoplasmata archaeon]|nr:zinc ribbon domain-containing protein [Thermoplasmata archaeon]
MAFCMKCGAQLPDGAQFCMKCGTPVGSPGGAKAPTAPAPPAPAATAPTIAAAGVQELKCPACGAPIKPTFGEMVITCDYCGGSVTLGGQGWKEISKHTMLTVAVADRDAALKVVRGYLDQGFLHRHFLEESKVAEEHFSFVPFWVIPASASTTYQYQAPAASIGATAGTMAAGALLGSALGGRRGGFTVVPIMAGPVVSPNRSETISGQYEYPVVAVKAMSSYQPKDYQFALSDRTFFDKKSIPANTPILNGDLGEDAARFAAEAYVKQLQSEAAHQKHHMVSALQSQVQVSEGELLHAPIWYFRFEHKDENVTVLIDGHSGRVIRTMQ